VVQPGATAGFHQGERLWETKLDTEGHTNPMTYMGRDGKQYVIVATSGINAFALE
jgi:glucose dehydrogenase